MPAVAFCAMNDARILVATSIGLDINCLDFELRQAGNKVRIELKQHSHLDLFGFKVATEVAHCSSECRKAISNLATGAVKNISIMEPCTELEHF